MHDDVTCMMMTHTLTRDSVSEECVRHYTPPVVKTVVKTVVKSVSEECVRHYAPPQWRKEWAGGSVKTVTQACQQSSWTHMYMSTRDSVSLYALCLFLLFVRGQGAGY